MNFERFAASKILGYKKGWAYRVFESRKQKTVPRYKASQFSKGKKTASDLSLSQKENIAKIFCLRDTQEAFNMIRVFQEGVYKNNSFTGHLTDQNTKHGVAEELWKRTGRMNDKNRIISKKQLKNLFMQMFAYPWDRNFIINYVTTVRQRKITVDPNSIYLK